MIVVKIGLNDRVKIGLKLNLFVELVLIVKFGCLE
jgi:hypothetical protein